MSRYFDADVIIQEAHRQRKTIVSVAFIEDMPTADVVEVVRCKDCKHRRVKGEGMTHWYGCLWRGSCNDNDFCNYGERAGE